MSESINNMYSLGQSVLIKALNIQGVIYAIYNQGAGNEYKVRYFNIYNDPCDTYFYEQELKTVASVKCAFSQKSTGNKEGST